MNSQSLGTSSDQEVIQLIENCVDDPLNFVLTVFPWGEPGTRLEKYDGPDQWQIEVLEHIRDSINAEDPDALRDAVMIAISSGHGIGKTALISWIILWFVSTRPHPQVIVTANTEAQLHNKTWRELSVWHKLAINSEWFQWTATKLYMKDHPETWFASAVTWSEKKPEAFAGTHEEHVLVLYDEASTIHDDIWEVTEGAMTGEFPMWIVFGNPTKNTGRFSECFKKFKHRWFHKQIDSRTCKMANKQQIQNWVDDYGEDSDFVRIRVRGLFPRAGNTQMFPTDVIEKCVAYDSITHEGMPIVVGVDVARQGDDQSVICVRQGRKILELRKFRIRDTMKLASIVSEVLNHYDVTLCNVDSVGIGAGVFDRLVQLGHHEICREVIAGERAANDIKFFNVRAEMYSILLEAMKGRVDIPEDKDLRSELEGIEYGYDNKERLQLERKVT